MPTGNTITHGCICLGGDEAPVTDVVLQEFEENYMVIITQIGKPGSMVSVEFVHCGCCCCWWPTLGFRVRIRVRINVVTSI